MGICIHGSACTLKFMTALKPLDLIKLAEAELVNAEPWSRERQPEGSEQQVDQCTLM